MICEYLGDLFKSIVKKSVVKACPTFFDDVLQLRFSQVGGLCCFELSCMNRCDLQGFLSFREQNAHN